MKLYHGTTVQGLESLSASSRNRDGKSVLYLTDSWVYSLFYIRDRDINFVTCGVGSDGAVHYDEKFPNQLSVLYRGLPGYVYEVETSAEKTKVEGIYLADCDTKVTGATYIPDAYDAIIEEIRKGTVRFLPYENLTEEQRKLNYEGALRYILSEKTMNTKKEAFYKEHFQDAWVEAQNILAQRK